MGESVRKIYFLLPVVVIVAISIFAYVSSLRTETYFFDADASWSKKEDYIEKTTRYDLIWYWTFHVWYLGDAPLTSVYIYVNGNVEKFVPVVEKGWSLFFNTQEVCNRSAVLRIVWSEHSEQIEFEPEP